jgi:hypothetical protein
MTDWHPTYIDFVTTVVASGELGSFKNDSQLEHLNETEGHEYLQNIVTRFSCSRSDIVNYCQLNDRHGNPRKYRYLGEQISPTSLRYFLHAMVILHHFNEKNLSPIRIVEIGAGYGGLCLAINSCLKFFPELKVTEYNLIDLTNPSKLQEMYLTNHTLSYPCSFLDAKNFGAEVEENDVPLFLISNYAFSEISFELQERYKEVLFPKVKHGFMVWNTSLRGFGKPIKVEEEYPKTGPSNLYVKF